MNGPEIKTVENLDALIEHMHAANYIHRKREYKLGEATPEMALTHLLEETVEYQAATIAFQGMKIVDQNKGTYEAKLEESADVLTCYLHANIICHLPLNQIIKRAAEKMKDIFIHPSEWKD